MGRKDTTDNNYQRAEDLERGPPPAFPPGYSAGGNMMMPQQPYVYPQYAAMNQQQFMAYGLNTQDFQFNPNQQQQQLLTNLHLY